MNTLWLSVPLSQSSPGTFTQNIFHLAFCIAARLKLQVRQCCLEDIEQCIQREIPLEIKGQEHYISLRVKDDDLHISAGSQKDDYLDRFIVRFENRKRKLLEFRSFPVDPKSNHAVVRLRADELATGLTGTHFIIEECDDWNEQLRKVVAHANIPERNRRLVRTPTRREDRVPARCQG